MEMAGISNLLAPDVLIARSALSNERPLYPQKRAMPALRRVPQALLAWNVSSVYSFVHEKGNNFTLLITTVSPVKRPGST